VGSALSITLLDCMQETSILSPYSQSEKATKVFRSGLAKFGISELHRPTRLINSSYA
jgi:hypothetical protein